MSLGRRALLQVAAATAVLGAGRNGFAQGRAPTQDDLLRFKATGQVTLLNYTGFNVLNVNALDGNDVINVKTAATGPNRNVLVDAGQPTGKNKGTDTLNVYYLGKRPKIVQSAATQNPDSGLVTLDYGTAQFSVQYVSAEVVNILKQ